MDKKCFCSMDRRRFLQAAGGTLACCALTPLAGSLVYADPISRTPIFPKTKAKVDLVFIHVASPRPTWPTKDYDYAKRKKEILDKLVPLCPNVEFTVRHSATNEQATAIIEEDKDRDGFLIYQIGLSTAGTDLFVRSGKPVVLADDLFGGTGRVLALSGAATAEKLPVVVVSSSDMKDVAAAANLFYVMRAMRKSRIISATNRNTAAGKNFIKDLYGSELLQLTAEELNDYYNKADAREAEAWADCWMKNARKVVEPTREEITKSGRMYLAMSRALADKRADAITIDCLGLFYSGKMTAYPCLGFFQLNNDGCTGVCEGDLDSTCSQLLLRYMTGRPGYVSDPVIDTSRDEIIYAHCVATNKVYGPKGKANPYLIRTHAEDEQGASVQSLMPTGEIVTTLKVRTGDKHMVVHTAKAVGNSGESKACRTKLVAKTNAKSLLRNWSIGWHRVTVYGDWREQAMNLARLYGMTVFEEDKA